MRFWTPDVYTAIYHEPDGMPSESCATLRQAHAKYLKDHEGVWPDHLIELARLPGLDDGILVKVENDPPARQLEITLRCGHLQMGYYDLVLTYGEAAMSPEHEQTLRRIAETTKSAWRHESDLFVQEIDVTEDGLIEHRLMFHPGAWFAIRCRELKWKRVDQPDREIPRYRKRFRAVRR